MKDHKQRSIEEKESNKWLQSLEAVEAARKACPETHFVSVGDREADIYDLFMVKRTPGVDLLVRAAENRRVEARNAICGLRLRPARWSPPPRSKCRRATDKRDALPNWRSDGGKSPCARR